MGYFILGILLKIVTIFGTVLPLVILDIPWWGILAFGTLIFFGLSKFINPFTYGIALYVELNRPYHDKLSIIFFIAFAIYAYHFVNSIIPLLYNGINRE